MGTVVVDVMLKSEILDPQGQAVAGALARLGQTRFTSVRQGKRFELEVAGAVTEEDLAAARDAADTLLSNPVMEDVVSVRRADADVLTAAQERFGWSDDDVEAFTGKVGGSAGVVRREAPVRRNPTDVDPERAVVLADGVYAGEEDDT